MNKWRVDIYLKSGTVLHCYVGDDDADTSLKVAQKYFQGNKESFNSLESLTGKKQVFYKLEDVEAFEISVY